MTTTSPLTRSRLPWRSAAAGWGVFAVAVVVGVPLFLRMPLWIDVTLYDVAARTILTGGTHYRDVFDTNPPGFVWLLCGVRSLLGPSIEAVRAVDLLVVGGIGFLLLRAALRAGAPPGGVAWGAAGMAGFYLFVSEFNHAQRDTWMMLPALLATGYRVRRVRAAGERPVTNGWVFRTALVEGLVWGAAVWIKPHVFPVALAVWAATQAELAASVAVGNRARRSLADALGALAGGLLAGAAGIAWLRATGTWPYFVEVFTDWNSGYVGQTFLEFGERYQCQLGYFPPWSLLSLIALPVAVCNVIEARPWVVRDPVDGDVGVRFPRWFYTPASDADARSVRLVLAVLYLAWVSTALFLQRQFHYVHVPETLLMIAVLAANRWAVVALALVLQVAVMAWLALIPTLGLTPAPEWRWKGKYFRHFVWTYPDRERDPDRLKWWAACVAPNASGEVRNGVAFQSDYFSGTDLAELEEVAAFLRNEGVKDHELMAYNDSPHVLYLMLDVRPAIRFMHLSTAPAIGETYYMKVWEELKEATERQSPKVRFVVSDLKRISVYEPPPNLWQFREPGRGPNDHLPPVIDEELRALYPLNQPTVFRSGGGRGRYIVHAQTTPIDDWTDLLVPW